MNRNTFLKTSAGLSPALLGFSCVPGEKTSERFFSVDRKEDRWFFSDPAGEPFFSIATNHIDSATLRYPENIDIWMDTYGNSKQQWLRDQVKPDLQSWGFIFAEPICEIKSANTDFAIVITT